MRFRRRIDKAVLCDAFFGRDNNFAVEFRRLRCCFCGFRKTVVVHVIHGIRNIGVYEIFDVIFVQRRFLSFGKFRIFFASLLSYVSHRTHIVVSCRKRIHVSCFHIPYADKFAVSVIGAAVFAVQKIDKRSVPHHRAVFFAHFIGYKVDDLRFRARIFSVSTVFKLFRPAVLRIFARKIFFGERRVKRFVINGCDEHTENDIRIRFFQIFVVAFLHIQLVADAVLRVVFRNSHACTLTDRKNFTFRFGGVYV